jgi:CHAD domain-containing protein
VALASSSGDHALRLIAHQAERLGALVPQVLADRDPEALHQLRVSLRRLRSLLRQFAAALLLPEDLRPGRIARVSRPTGRCRDLDVQLQLLEQLAPDLTDAGGVGLKPLRRQLRLQRRRAFRDLRQALRAGRLARLQQQLDAWRRSPRYSALGRQPLEAWRREWLLVCCGGCFLQGGWLVEDPRDPELHALRRRLKGVRYGLESLQEHLGPETEAWIGTLKAVQACLGELQDLQVLEQSLAGLDSALPGAGLLRSIEQRRWACWQRWLELRQPLLQPQRRAALLDLGASPTGELWLPQPGPNPC